MDSMTYAIENQKYKSNTQHNGNNIINNFETAKCTDGYKDKKIERNKREKQKLNARFLLHYVMLAHLVIVGTYITDAKIYF